MAATVAIETEYLGTLDVRLAPPLHVGARLIFNGFEGTIKGPKISGTFVAPSGDWPVPQPDGGFRVDVRNSFKTDDGEFVFMEYNGVLAGSIDRLAKGETLTSKDVYFIVAPRFTTESKTYAWLNKLQAVGKVVSWDSERLIYDIFAVR